MVCLASPLNPNSSYFNEDPEVFPTQDTCWRPIIEKIRKHRGFNDIRTSRTIELAGQSNSLIAEARKILLSEPSGFVLAGFEHLTRALKSFLLPLALYDGLIDLKQAVGAAQLESDIQARKWGSVEDHHDLQRSQLNKSAQLGYLFLCSPRI
jgi:chaperone required for assembly of F1-ATPase